MGIKAQKPVPACSDHVSQLQVMEDAVKEKQREQEWMLSEVGSDSDVLAVVQPIKVGVHSIVPRSGAHSVVPRNGGA